VLFHDGTNSFNAVVLDRSGALQFVTYVDGSGFTTDATTSATVSESTEYELRVEVRKRQVKAWIVGQSVVLTHTSAVDFGSGYVGVYADKTGVTFDDFTFNRQWPHDPGVPGWIMAGDFTISAGNNIVSFSGSTRGGFALVDGPAGFGQHHAEGRRPTEAHAPRRPRSWPPSAEPAAPPFPGGRPTPNRSAGRTSLAA